MEGREVGNYVLEKKLGQGGMGGVWLGRHKSLGTPAAIKVLNVAFGDDPEFHERFSREARTQAQLRHPHIAQVLDHVEQDGRWYLISEYLGGGTLKDALIETGGRLDPERAVSWVWQALQGLDYAHQKGIIHRDVKPANILINERGEAAMTDFGLALTLGDQRLTSTGMAIGTPQYMSPEQVEGASDIDHRTDVYSMGAVLYELLTGRVPIELKSTFEIHKVLVEAPTPPRDLVPELPADLEGAVMKALAKLPEERFTSCKEFAAALAPFAGDAASSRPSVPPPGIAAPVGTASATENDAALNDTKAPTLATPPPIPPPPPAAPTAGDATPPGIEPTIVALGDDTQTSAATRSPSSLPAWILLLLFAALGLVALAGVGAGAWWWLTQREASDEEPAVTVADLEPETETVRDTPRATTTGVESRSLVEESAVAVTNAPPTRPPEAEEFAAPPPTADSSGVPAGQALAAGTAPPAPSPTQMTPPAPSSSPTTSSPTTSPPTTSPPTTSPRGAPPRARPLPERPTVAVISIGDPTFGSRLEADVEQRFSRHGLDLFDEGNSFALQDLLSTGGAGFAELVGALEADDVQVVVLIEVEPIGERELYYLGRRALATQARVRLNAFLVGPRHPLGPGWNREIEYTPLNAARKAEVMSAPIVRELGAAIRDGWQEYRRRVGR